MESIMWAHYGGQLFVLHPGNLGQRWVWDLLESGMTLATAFAVINIFCVWLRRLVSSASFDETGNRVATSLASK